MDTIKQSISTPKIPTVSRQLAQTTAVSSPLSGRANHIMQLQRAIGNQAVIRLMESGVDTGQTTPLTVQRMFDEKKDFAKDVTGLNLWNKYTPDKDKGAIFLNFLAGECNTPNQIDTGVLTTKGKGHQKVSAFLNSVFANFAGNAFIASAIIHKNDEGRYTVDAANPNRYAEMGIRGVGQTRVVLDRTTQVLYLSTHYEAPKIIRINGASPAAAIAYIEQQASWAD